jgi:hypothetical protein
MRDLSVVILWAEAVETFKRDELPYIKRKYERDGIPDYCARSEHWNNYTDSLCKARQISDWQYENWSHPDCCNAPWER